MESKISEANSHIIIFGLREVSLMAISIALFLMMYYRTIFLYFQRLKLNAFWRRNPSNYLVNSVR